MLVVRGRCWVEGGAQGEGEHARGNKREFEAGAGRGGKRRLKVPRTQARRHDTTRRPPRRLDCERDGDDVDGGDAWTWLWGGASKEKKTGRQTWLCGD